MEEEALLQELEEMAGSPALARAAKKCLDQLSHGTAGPELAELARDVLAGRIGLRTATRSSAYAVPLTEAIDSFRRWDESLTRQERGQVIAEARAQLER